MYILLEAESEIRRAQRELEATIRQALPQTETRNIGWQGGRKVGRDISTDGTYWFYSDDHFKGTPHRRNNWFGQIKPGTGVAITVEVNLPYEGISNRVAGFFARNVQTGRTYLFHSGRVGGGTPGVKKDALVWAADLTPTQVSTASGEMREGFIVMPTSGKGAIRPALAYVQAIIDFKEAVRLGTTQTPKAIRETAALRDYYDEFFGLKRGKGSRNQVDYVSRHGEVVKELKEHLEPGLKAGQGFVKNQYLDLGVAADRKLLVAYEVKSGCSRGEIYTAIGQLLVHGNVPSCKRTLVIPRMDEIPRDLTDALEQHRIGVLFYRLTATSVEFEP